MMKVKEYALQFQQLSRYAPMLVFSMKEKMRKFASGLFHDIVLDYKAAMLNNDMDIYRIVVYIQQVDNEKKRQTELWIGRERSLNIQSRVEVSRIVEEIIGS